MYPIVIDKIGKERVLPTGTKIVELSVRRLDTQEEMKIDCFLGKDGELSVSTGQEFTIPIEKKEYKGKPQYSTVIWKWEALSQEKKVEIKKEQVTENDEKSLEIALNFDNKKDMAQNLLTMFNEVCPEWYKQSGPASATFLEIAKILLSKREN